MIWNRVWAVGRDSYVRFYPNPGVGLSFGKYRVALSLWRGAEIFRRHQKLGWQCCWRRLNWCLEKKKWG